MIQNAASHLEFSKKVNKKLPIFDNEKELANFMANNFLESLKQMIRSTVNIIVREEMDKFRQEVDDKIYFNGSYSRQMMSTLGKIDNVPVPRFRQKQTDFTPQSLSVFDSQQERFVKLIEQMHLMGISQRKISQLAKDCFGITFSKNRVGKVYAEFARQESVNINSQPITDNFEYLYFDGVYVKSKGYGYEDNKAVLLCVLGVKADGLRKIIGFTFARAEDYESWLELIDNLKGRGLKTETIKLAITDGGTGLKSALRFSFPNLPTQLCIVHKSRNVITKTKFKNKRELANDLKAVFNQETKEQSQLQAKIFCKKWYLIEPTAVEIFRKGFDDCLTYFQFPKDQWHQVRTTNILEREFRELRRRIKVFDNSFNSQSSTENYANTIFTNLNQTYPAYQFLHTNY
jgi:putative transposase